MARQKFPRSQSSGSNVWLYSVIFRGCRTCVIVFPVRFSEYVDAMIATGYSYGDITSKNKLLQSPSVIHTHIPPYIYTLKKDKTDIIYKRDLSNASSTVVPNSENVILIIFITYNLKL